MTRSLHVADERLPCRRRAAARPAAADSVEAHLSAGAAHRRIGEAPRRLVRAARAVPRTGLDGGADPDRREGRAPRRADDPVARPSRADRRRDARHRQRRSPPRPRSRSRTRGSTSSSHSFAETMRRSLLPAGSSRRSPGSRSATATSRPRRSTSAATSSTSSSCPTAVSRSCSATSRGTGSTRPPTWRWRSSCSGRSRDSIRSPLRLPRRTRTTSSSPRSRSGVHHDGVCHRRADAGAFACAQRRPSPAANRCARTAASTSFGAAASRSGSPPTSKYERGAGRARAAGPRSSSTPTASSRRVATVTLYGRRTARRRARPPRRERAQASRRRRARRLPQLRRGRALGRLRDRGDPAAVNLRRADGPPLVIGHRGAAASRPENTLAVARRRRVAAGADLVEFDIGPDLRLAHSTRERPVDCVSLDDALEFLSRHDRRGPPRREAAGLRGGARRRRSPPRSRGRVRSSRPPSRRPRGGSSSSRRRCRARSAIRATASVSPRFTGRAALTRAGAAALAPGDAAARCRCCIRRARANVLALHHTLCSQAAVAAAHRAGVPGARVDGQRRSDRVRRLADSASTRSSRDDPRDGLRSAGYTDAPVKRLLFPALFAAGFVGRRRVLGRRDRRRDHHGCDHHRAGTDDERDHDRAHDDRRTTTAPTTTTTAPTTTTTRRRRPRPLRRGRRHSGRRARRRCRGSAG